jgi:hypothetical protein
MSASDPFLKIRRDRFEVLQGADYVPIDRERLEAVHFHDGVMTVRYKAGGEAALDCRRAKSGDVMNLLRTLQTQRDRNQKEARRAKERRDIGSILPGILG